MAGATRLGGPFRRAAASAAWIEHTSCSSARALGTIRHFSQQAGNCRPAATSTHTTSNVLRWRGDSSLRPRPQQLDRISHQYIRRRQRFSTTPISQHGHLDPPKPGEERTIHFIDKEGDKHTFTVADGDNLLDIAQANDLDMEGACGGSCACSTCHIIVEDTEMYDKMDEPDDDENDMLDLAFGLTETSRLGCQVKMSKELDGLVVKLPSMTRNLQASDFESK